ncbi:MAG: starvation-sensing protein RspA [Anaerolineales bacterium]|uniref:Starvation-sensing protein RspA n=1 Tax=Candidatus Desulfolinea nitratireducens TaxID=2841698 RepID=A0A8J6NMK4_9CHLR|nr:starvation-sensing protein RspA [Candidatus Desulfolinea nitratireducens]
MKITNVKSILTAPEGIALVVVKVETDQPGLYGLGCATFTQRPTLVANAVDEYLAPLLQGRDPANIEDLWHMMHVNSYWRNGPVLNNAISGVDMALWDIKGKEANMPVYDLLGGKCREAAMVYRHADGRDPQEVLDNVLNYQEEGYLAVRCQMGGYGGRVKEMTDDTVQPGKAAPQATHRIHMMERLNTNFPGAYYDPDWYARSVVELFEHVRTNVGDDLFLLHDVHERLTPMDAIRLAKALEPYRLFFLEDPLAPDQIEWFRRLRDQCATPIAMGELHNNPLEWRMLIAEQLIDYIRAHISQLGGLTPARKLASLCEAFGVRTAWHGPGDVSPVGHAANLHLDLACHNFGIQEVINFSDVLYEVFPGTPELRGGYVWSNGKPGFGVDIDEEKAAQYPIEIPPITWTQSRWPDGTIWTP